MTQRLKTVLTALVCVVCIGVSLGCVCYYSYFRTELEEETDYEVSLEMKGAALERFDDERYRGYRQEGYELYQLYLTMENTGNMQKAGDMFYLYYAPADESYMPIYELGRNYFDEDGTVLPPGKEAVMSRILSVPKDCREIRIRYNNYYTDEEQVLNVKVPMA